MVILDGALTANTPARSAVLGDGEVVILPPGQVNRLGNSGQRDAHYFLLCVLRGSSGSCGVRVCARAVAVARKPGREMIDQRANGGRQAAAGREHQMHDALQPMPLGRMRTSAPASSASRQT